MTYTPTSPAKLLANLIEKKENNGLWILTGDRQIGKTTWCASLAQQAQAEGISVGGVLCPAVFSGKEKIGFTLIDLKSGEHRCFGINDPVYDGWVKMGCWFFNPKVIAWANEQLKLCIDCELLILDELGPLEFTHNQGFQEGMKLLDKGQYQTALAVVRPELVNAAQKRWPHAKLIEIKNERND